MNNGAAGLETIGLGKRFGGFVALDAVSLRFDAGGFHALLGENGAGKSTLVKALVGFHRADEGDVIYDRRQRDIRHPRDADALGIGMVYQHFTLVPALSVAENLVLARANLPPIVHWPMEKVALRAFLASTPFELPLDAPVSSLSAGQKQKLEILKQLYLQRRFLILDEPTSMLTPGEADEVLGHLHGLTRRGRLTVLLITHRFREVLRYCDTVQVLRRGRHAGGGAVAGFGPDDLARMMMGERVILHEERPRRPPSAGPVVLETEGLWVRGDVGLPAVADFSLTVRSGEIVGIAGVSGNGQRELVEALVGQRPIEAGGLRIDGRPFRPSRAAIARHGIAALPELPLANACVPELSVAGNLLLRDFERRPYARFGWLRWGPIRARARALIEQFRVRPAEPSVPIRSLSGGNVQRVVLARELSRQARVLIIANPTFGLDFAAVAEIHARILDARDGGAAVLLVSEDLDELLQLADRIVVLSGGRAVYETPADQAEPAALGRYMAGH